MVAELNTTEPLWQTFGNSTIGTLQTVIHQDHGSLVLVFIIGIIFGGIIQFTRVDKFEKIAGFAMLKDMTVPKMLFLAVGLSSIALYFMIINGFASYHVKPIMVQGLVIGGILFGASMAILGKCPGTGPISVAEGRIDVLVGAIGGILGGVVFTIYYDDIFKPLMGTSRGSMVLTDFFNSGDEIVVLLFGIAVIAISIMIPDIEIVDEIEEEHCAK
jgi:hypothetical protein